MTFAEEAETKFTQLLTEHRNNMFHRLASSHRGEPMVIKFLWLSDRAVSPKEIACKLGLSTARIAAILGNLEKKGEIRRDISPEDRRRISVYLTEKGKKEAQQNFQRGQQKMVAVFDCMGKEEAEQFIRSVEKFLIAIQKVEKEGR